MSRTFLPCAALLGLALGGCTPQPAEVDVVPAFISAEIESREDGRCFGRDITPAVIETVTAQVLDRPAVLAEDGTVLTPAAYRSVIRQEIARERQEVAFETLCPPFYTDEFVSTLQRALKARGYYLGDITGHLDVQTGRAVQDFQRGKGPDSPLLWIGSARELGIVSLTAEQLATL